MQHNTILGLLEIDDSNIRLGNQTWAVRMVRTVGVRYAGAGLSLVIFGLLTIIFAVPFMLSVFDYRRGPDGFLFCFVSACGAITFLLSRTVGYKEVWIKTGAIPTVLIKTKDAKLAQAVKERIEQAISMQTASG